jgi:hypothetical protein
MAKKYKGITWNPTMIRRWFRAGKTVSEIAQRCGYPKDCGNNRVRNVLIKAGLKKQAR